MWTLCKTDEGCGDGNKRLEANGEFVIASGDATKMFNSGKEPFNEVSTSVMIDIVVTRLLAVGPGRNDCLGAQLADTGQESGCVKGFVRKDCADTFHAVEKIRCLSDVMSFAPSETKSSQVAQTIDCGVNLGTQSPTRTANTLLALFFDAPAACWCARTIVLSRNTSSKSASFDSVANIFCQTPLSAQREKRRKTLFHAPNSGGRSRHGTPVRAIHSTASTNSRLSAPVRPRSPSFPWSNGSIRTHWSSRNSNLSILSSPKRQNVNTIRDL